MVKFTNYLQTFKNTLLYTILKYFEDSKMKKINIVALLLLVSVNSQADGFLDFFKSKATNAKINLACVQMKSIHFSLQLFQLDNAMYPETEEGLEALLSNPDEDKYPQYARSAYLKILPVDSWKSKFVYMKKGDSFELLSYGADKKEGGEGDNKDIYLSKCKK